MLNINIYTRNEGSKVKFSKIFVGAKSVFLKSVGAAAPTAPTLTRPLGKYEILDEKQFNFDMKCDDH